MKQAGSYSGGLFFKCKFVGFALKFREECIEMNHTRDLLGFVEGKLMEKQSII